jgi:hypothetical protein
MVDLLPVHLKYFRRLPIWLHRSLDYQPQFGHNRALRKMRSTRYVSREIGCYPFKDVLSQRINQMDSGCHVGRFRGAERAMLLTRRFNWRISDVQKT